MAQDVSSASVRVPLFLLAILFYALPGKAQQTVGLFVYTDAAYPGYNLFTPSASHNTYLIDNCGRHIHQWSSDHTPGQSAYLMEDGSLLRTARLNSTFQGGGTGGRVEKIAWDNTITWSFTYSTTAHHQHHDIEPLPNGNVLILAWERIPASEAIARGRKASTIHAQGLWPDHIVEVRQTGPTEGEIVWEWHVWDHLIQDYDNTKLFYGNVVDHPELIDVNYASEPLGNATDWLHSNSIDYNATLDQIVISVHNFNEIWIIDHSTTTEEAASHMGGNAGKGGDLLYRWGNPEAYQRGNEDDRVFNGQHNTRWVPPGFPGEGQISVFNNNHQNGPEAFSSVDYFLPPMDTSGKYVLNPGATFGPSELEWTYDGMPDDPFYSIRLSSAQRLFNGNTLICSGNMGKFIEVNQEKEVVWEYVSPLSGDIAVSQGSNPVLNDIFHVERYALDYPAFDGRDVTPGLPLEGDPLPLLCDTTSSVHNTLTGFGLTAMPNPTSEHTILSNPEGRSLIIDIFAAGQMHSHRQTSAQPNIDIDLKDFAPGLVLVRCTDQKTFASHVLKLLKL